jgi:hypothetical protein
MAKSKPTTADLHAESAMHAGLLRQAQSQLAEVLRAGGDTAPLREEIRRRQHRQMEITLLMAAAAGDQAEADAAQIGMKASARSRRVKAEIATMLAELAVPTAPNHA